MVFEDRSSLPYTESVLYEAMRIRPVGPLGVPRATNVDAQLRKTSLYIIYCY